MSSQNASTIPLGIIYSQTGVTANVELSMLRATLLSIDRINRLGGVNGQQLEALCLDPESIAENYGKLAQQLIVEKGVKLIFGGYTSSSRKAMLPVVCRYNVLLFYPTHYEGFEYAPNVIYTGAAPNQGCLQLAQYMLDNVGKRVCMVGSDYIWPREINRIMRDLVTESNGEILSESYRSLETDKAAVEQVVKEVIEQKPDFIFANFVGKSIEFFYQAMFDLTSGRPIAIASLTTTETDIQAMGVDAGKGHYTSAPYFQSIDSPINIELVNEYKSIYGNDQVTNMCWEAAYFQVQLAIKALQLANSYHPDDILEQLPKVKYMAPQGEVQIDAENHHSYLWPRIGQVNSQGQFDILATSKFALKPDPFLVLYSASGPSAMLVNATVSEECEQPSPLSGIQL
jgi:branched-chain amino acid transport system substrate-binding protein